MVTVCGDGITCTDNTSPALIPVPSKHSMYRATVVYIIGFNFPHRPQVPGDLLIDMLHACLVPSNRGV